MLTMKKTALTLLALWLAVAVVQARSPRHPFNGRNLEGWVGYVGDTALDRSSQFTVQDGMIRVEGALGYIRTEKEYSDYRLTLQWRWVGEPTNSGIFFHMQPGEDRLWPCCYECQLWVGHAGDVNNAGRSESDEFRRLGAATVPKREPSSERPAGEWNDTEILCDGSTVAIYVNGVLQNRLTNVSNDRGRIALEGEGSPILFRHIKIVPLRNRDRARLRQDI